MKKVIVGFSRPLKWKPFAELIMWWDKSNISHGYVKFISDRWGTSFIYQSSGHRTNFEGSTLFNSINKTVEEYSIDVPDEIEAKIGKLCVDREGIPYGILQIVGIAISGIVKIVTFTKVKLKNFLAQPGQTVCIEEVGIILKEGLKIDCPLDLDLSTVKPFRDWIASLPCAQKISGDK